MNQISYITLNMIIQKRKEHYQNNKDYYRNSSNNYMRNRRKNDPLFRILINLRGRLSRAIKANTFSFHTKDLLGCTLEELKIHLSN